jgi:hypothetical protein
MTRKTFSGIGAFLQTPVGVVIAMNVLWHVVAWLANIGFNPFVSIFVLVVDIAVAYFLLDRLTYFFAQFILPIQNPKHRQEIFKRVKDFETGKRGPALFIKNGRVIAHEGEKDKKGPGLIVLDTASAAVLRTDTEFKDTIGPGIKFTQGNEYIAGSVDLRLQWQYIGPGLGKVNTQAQLRDNTNAFATISLKFGIRRPQQNKPTESGVTSQYGYDEEAVRRAVLHEVIQSDDEYKKPMAWNEFPASLVVELWREYAQKFKFNELFAINEYGESSLQIIEKMINLRVQQSTVEELDDMGYKTGAMQNSRQFKDLQEHGLEITEVRIHNVYFDAPTEEQILSKWLPDWQKNIQQEEKNLKSTETLIGTLAREEASKRFSLIVSDHFIQRASESVSNPFKAMQTLIRPLKEFILEQSSANKDVEGKLRDLDEIWKWLLDHGAEFARAQEEKQ